MSELFAMQQRAKRHARAIARRRIASGALPCGTPPHRMWGGYGSGKACAVCDKAIEPAEVEFEIEESIGGQVKQMWCHILCQAAWQIECARAVSFAARG
jgi:hypothetical protein